MPVSASRRPARAIAVVAAVAPLAAAQTIDTAPPSAAREPVTSIWEPVYTEAQARRGERVYPGPCGSCHGRRLNGAADDPDMRPSPPLAGSKFLRDWNGRSLGALFDYTRAAMPESNPGFLSDAEYVDIIAYMLSISGTPAGDRELEADPERLAGIVIQQRP